MNKSSRKPRKLSTFPGRKSDYHGYERYDFVVDQCDAIVVVSPRAAAGNPWIWRAEFFDHRPETDLALLSRGFHLAYIQVSNTFGCPDAMAHGGCFIASGPENTIYPENRRSKASVVQFINTAMPMKSCPTRRTPWSSRNATKKWGAASK